jgi:predicted Zn-dependent protease
MSADKIAAFEGILAQNPDDAFARYGLAMEYRNRNESDAALRQFDELHRRHPDYVPGYQMAAQILIAMGDALQARERLHTGIASARSTGNRHAASEMEGMLQELEELPDAYLRADRLERE